MGNLSDGIHNISGQNKIIMLLLGGMMFFAINAYGRLTAIEHDLVSLEKRVERLEGKK